ncbi:hypothetical protein [Bradyrhizobium betae]|uniref:Uncharacterized protein n=1 Tax=Bradyrhizobium betae TaxID=244734 RepID=A0A5P6NYL1_9BRAD|nr:hypothetical protein [Bradyrhizobium betae]MCS3725495.1 hypothetical protein [Bradyrhizobium betae]QFI71217.1 hypothetical protein F8237_01805 [Bradyrhizobium betae]
MAKSALKAVPGPATAEASRKYDEWEVREAMRTLMRAEEIQGDKKLMAMVRKEAAAESAKMAEVSRKAERLARSGHISDKQLAKLKKEKPIASGKEGDTGASQTSRGIATK